MPYQASKVTTRFYEGLFKGSKKDLRECRV